MWTTSLGYGFTHRHPDCAPLASSPEVEGQKEEEKARVLGVVTGAPTSPPLGSGLSGLGEEAEGGESGGAVDSMLGFPATAAGLSQNSLSLFEGPCTAASPDQPPMGERDSAVRPWIYCKHKLEFEGI